MSKKPLLRIITGAVIVTVASAAVLTFTRGESPVTDTASATLPGVSTSGPVVEGTATTPRPSDSATTEAAQREAEDEKADSSGTTKPARTSPTAGGDTTTPPPSTPPKSPQPDPEPDPKPAPAPDPTPSNPSCLLIILLCSK